jgi:transcriptional regulator with XRE-family HTH domain
MRRFDATALYRALDEQRTARGQSWREVADAIGVSVATITRLRSGGRMEVDGMLAMVAWLGVPVETVVRETNPEIG